MSEPSFIRIATLYDDLTARMAELGRTHEKVGESRKVVERALADGKAYYGINTGFGALASKRIDPSSLDQLQYNLLVSHAVGLGALVPRELCKLMLELKLHSLSLGFSGISEPAFALLLKFAEIGLVPAVPSKG